MLFFFGSCLKQKKGYGQNKGLWACIMETCISGSIEPQLSNEHKRSCQVTVAMCCKKKKKKDAINRTTFHVNLALHNSCHFLHNQFVSCNCEWNFHSWQSKIFALGDISFGTVHKGTCLCSSPFTLKLQSKHPKSLHLCRPVTECLEWKGNVGVLNTSSYF